MHTDKVYTHTHRRSFSLMHTLSVARTRHKQLKQSDSYVHSRLLIVSSCVGERATKRMEERFRERKGEKKRETGRVLAFMSLPCACVRCVYAASATIKWPASWGYFRAATIACSVTGEWKRGEGIKNISTRRTKVKLLSRKSQAGRGKGRGLGQRRMAAALLFRAADKTESRLLQQQQEENKNERQNT